MTAYWIAHVTVTDPEAYQGYQALAPAAFAAHGARFLARGGAHEVLEGPSLDRHVVIEFQHWPQRGLATSPPSIRPPAPGARGRRWPMW